MTLRRVGRAASLGAQLLLALVVVPACSDEGGARSASGERGERGAGIAPVIDSARIERVFARADSLPRLRSLIIQWRDAIVREAYWEGAEPDRLTNIKSASKSVLSAAVGIAIAEGHLRGTDQAIGELLPDATRGLEPAKQAITVGDLLSMRAGLESTSFGGYGRWVSSRNWVRAALAQPVVAPRGEEGGPMIYSTGSSHLLSAILTRVTGTSTHRYMADRLFAPLGITLRPWTTDPQGISFGGNEMRLSPRSLLAFGSLYLHGGRAPGGRQVIPAAWIDSSWVPRGRSPWSGDQYGYGWWLRPAGEHTVYYAWGYGGQFVFVVPSLQLVVVATSAADVPRGGDHIEAIRRLVTDEIVPAVSREGRR